MNLKNIFSVFQRLEELSKNEKLMISQEEQKNVLNTEMEFIKQNVNKVIEFNNFVLKRVKKIQELDEYILKRNEKIQELDEWILERNKKIQELDEAILKRCEKIQEYGVKTSRASNENVWSAVFHDTVCNSNWLLNKKFSPGRWAVGYQYLYVLYRTLEAIHPHNILELGLGQSTQMITQYAEYSQECQHFVVEHDSSWIKFYENTNDVLKSSTIIQLDLCKKQVREDNDVIGYAGFKETFSGQKFDLISIDAPFGTPCYIYARTDILELLPDCLKKDFVILLDDYNRKGEQNMIKLLKEKLEDKQIEYCEGIYSGNKDTFVITSLKYKFLVSL